MGRVGAIRFLEFWRFVTLSPQTAVSTGGFTWFHPTHADFGIKTPISDGTLQGNNLNHHSFESVWQIQLFAGAAPGKQKVLLVHDPLPFEINHGAFFFNSIYR